MLSSTSYTIIQCGAVMLFTAFFVPSFTDLLQQHTMLQCTSSVKLAITKTTLSWHCSILSYEGLKMRLCQVMPYVSFNAFLSFCKWPFIPYRHNNKQYRYFIRVLHILKFKLGETTKSASEAQMGFWQSRFHCIQWCWNSILRDHGQTNT